MNLKHFKHAFGQNAFHFVWKIKYAMDSFKFYGLKAGCQRFIHEVAVKHGCKIYELHVAIDHVHLFVELPPTMSVSRALQLFKGISALGMICSDILLMPCGLERVLLILQSQPASRFHFSFLKKKIPYCYHTQEEFPLPERSVFLFFC